MRPALGNTLQRSSGHRQVTGRYNARRKGLSTDVEGVEKPLGGVSKAKEMWQPRRSGEPLLLKPQDAGAERAAASRPARDARDGTALQGHERPVRGLE